MLNVLLVLVPLFLSSLAYGEQSGIVTEFKGEFRIRSEVRSNVTYNGRANPILMRLRPDLSVRPNSDLLFFFQPQMAKVWGDTIQAGTLTQQTSGAFTDPPVLVHQAYVNYLVAPKLEFIVGRQVLSYGDELLVGAGLGWQIVGRSFDAVRSRSTYDFGTTDLFYSRIVDADVLGPNNSTDRDFYGFYNSWKPGPMLQAFDLYALYLEDKKSIEWGKLNLWTLGTRVKSNLGQFDYRAELDYQIGSTAAGGQFANQADAELGVTVLKDSKTRIAVSGFTSSRRFDNLFSAAHRWLGTADVLDRRNLSGGLLRLAGEPITNWSFQADLLRFFRTSLDTPVYPMIGRGALGSVKKSSSAVVGTELDVHVQVNTSKMTRVTVGSSVLFQGDYLKQNFGDKKTPFYSYVQLETRY
jgi:hypothetical protein